MTGTLLMGIDIGSTTTKIVVLAGDAGIRSVTDDGIPHDGADDDGRRESVVHDDGAGNPINGNSDSFQNKNAILYSEYRRHNAAQAASVCDALRRVKERFPHCRIRAALTGSGSRPIADCMGLPFIQEVVANSIALKETYETVGTAIELGGQDAKMIFFTGGGSADAGHGSGDNRHPDSPPGNAHDAARAQVTPARIAQKNTSDAAPATQESAAQSADTKDTAAPRPASDPLRVDDMRMNGSCAGGTGAFVDEVAVILKTRTEDFNALAEAGTRVYDISGRCGVYAKTDIQPLLNQGASRADLALSAFHAIAKQTIGGLAQGLDIRRPVVFEGGPLTFNPRLIAVFQERLGLSAEDTLVPEHPEIMVAYGAALSLRSMFADKTEDYDPVELIARLQHGDLRENVTDLRLVQPYFRNAEEREAFDARNREMPFS